MTVQWLRLCAHIAGGVGLIPGWRTKIPHAVRCGPKKKKTVLRMKLRLSNTLFFSLKILWVIKSYCLPVFSNAFFFFYIMLKRINRKKYSLLCISTLQTFVVFQLFSQLSHVWLFVTPCAAAYQASLSITNPQSLLKLMSIKSVMPSNHLILYHPFPLLPSILPSIFI